MPEIVVQCLCGHAHAPHWIGGEALYICFFFCKLSQLSLPTSVNVFFADFQVPYLAVVCLLHYSRDVRFLGFGEGFEGTGRVDVPSRRLQ